jgi:CheY-like chemotaxis protein
MTISGNEHYHGNILLVDDVEPVRELISRILTDCGFCVLKVSGGAEAVDIATAYPGDIDLLLTDLFMRGMDGCEVADRVTALRPGTAVLVMSGDEPALLRRLRWSSIQKPFSQSELIAALDKLLEVRQHRADGS